MAGKGFTIKDILKRLKIDLNVLLFLGRQNSYHPNKLRKVEKISPLRILVECAIGRIKVYCSILKGPISVSMARLANQIVVCAFPMNSQIMTQMF